MHGVIVRSSVGDDFGVWARVQPTAPAITRPEVDVRVAGGLCLIGAVGKGVGLSELVVCWLGAATRRGDTVCVADAECERINSTYSPEHSKGTRVEGGRDGRRDGGTEGGRHLYRPTRCKSPQ